MKNNIGEARRSYALTTETGTYTQEDAARDFGVSLSAYRRWEQGVSKGLKGEQLRMMSEKFGVTVDYLIGVTDRPTYNYALVSIPERPQDTLTDEERDLLDTFRSLDDRGRQAALYAVRGIAAAHRQSGDAQNTVAG